MHVGTAAARLEVGQRGLDDIEESVEVGIDHRTPVLHRQVTNLRLRDIRTGRDDDGMHTPFGKDALDHPARVGQIAHRQLASPRAPAVRFDFGHDLRSPRLVAVVSQDNVGTELREAGADRFTRTATTTDHQYRPLGKLRLHHSSSLLFLWSCQRALACRRRRKKTAAD
ncbi:hypothetical protein FQZ97_959000 [compost metagenome]